MGRTDARKNTAEIPAPIPRNPGTLLAKPVTFVPPPAGPRGSDRPVSRPLSRLGIRSGTAFLRLAKPGGASIAWPGMETSAARIEAVILAGRSRGGATALNWESRNPSMRSWNSRSPAGAVTQPTPAGEVRPILQRFGCGATLVRLAGAQPGKSVGAPFLAANAMMDGEETVGIVFLLHGGQPGIV